MEDFVYIILLVVWLLVSFLRRKPKKKPEPAKQQEPASAEGEVSMEEMLEDFFGGGKKKERSKPGEVQYESVEQRERAEPAAIKSTSDYEKDRIPANYENHVGKSGVSEDFEFSSEGKIMTIDDLIKSHKAKEAMELAMAEQDYDRDNAEGVPDFDLKTAVVFSEILNKKYY